MNITHLSDFYIHHVIINYQYRGMHFTEADMDSENGYKF